MGQIKRHDMKPDYQNPAYFTATDRERKVHGLYLTKNHAASSYGIPVFVDQDSKDAYGPFDMVGWEFLSFGGERECQSARKAGYPVPV